jgi:hypothetical protein
MRLNRLPALLGIGFLLSQSAHAVVMGPLATNPMAPTSNCDISSSNASSLKQSPATLDEKTQLQSQLCSLQNQAKMQQQLIQNQIQGLVNTQIQIQALQQKVADAKVKNTDYNWVQGQAHVIPNNALVAGQNNGKNIYICQAQYSGNPPGYAATNLYPGELVPEGCVITYAGQTFVIDPYNILTSSKTGYWASPDQTTDEPLRSSPVYVNGNNPLSQSIVNFQQTTDASAPQSVIGGYEDDHYLYVCRIKVDGVYHVGKVVSGSCNVSIGNKEASWPDYQVLMTTKPSHS